jgi:hypothetical protein
VNYELFLQNTVITFHNAPTSLPLAEYFKDNGTIPAQG